MPTTDELIALKKAAGISTMPTALTYELRMAASGEGPRAYDWQDKPHRLLYDACGEIERLTAQLAEARQAERVQRGEFICTKCYLRQDADFTPGDF